MLYFNLMSSTLNKYAKFNKIISMKIFFYLFAISIACILFSCILFSCKNHDSIMIDLQTLNNQPISACVEVYRNNKWYHKIFNPVGSTYHPRYMVSRKNTKNKFAIIEGDLIQLYINDKFVPFTIEFNETQSMEIDKYMVNNYLIYKKFNKEKRGLLITFKYRNGLFAVEDICKPYSLQGIQYCQQSFLYT